MKRWLRILTAVCILLCGLFAASAMASSYEILSADFEVELNEDASAYVTETWKVHFQSGSFTRFYKDISYSNISSDERFSSISDVVVTIDGKACQSTTKTSERPDYHYNLSGTKPGATLSAYLASSGDITRTYVFFYKLNDVVKQYGDKYYFIYRYIGDNFSKTVKRVTIRVTAPQSGVIQKVYTTKGTCQAEGNVLTLTTTNSYGMLRLNASVEGAAFTGAAVLSSSP